MHLLVSNIQWDTDGETLDDCFLPETVLVLNAPDQPDDETISTLLSEAFGFCHKGFNSDTMIFHTHAGGGIFPRNLAFCYYPAD